MMATDPAVAMAAAEDANSRRNLRRRTVKDASSSSDMMDVALSSVMSVSLSSSFILNAKSFSRSQSSCFALFLLGSDGTAAHLLADDDETLRSSFRSSRVAAALGTGEKDSTFVVVRTQQQQHVVARRWALREVRVDGIVLMV